VPGHSIGKGCLGTTILRIHGCKLHNQERSIIENWPCLTDFVIGQGLRGWGGNFTNGLEYQWVDYDLLMG
jgi:hypothetical protein